ncbi:MAG: DUF4974 domain-containing protein [Cyclobacteriaceae bacterium]
MDQKIVTPTERRRKVISLSDSWEYALRVAAILFFPFIFTWIFLDMPQNQGVIELSGAITVEAPAGVKRTTVLPDGSKVMLNARSTITYTVDSNTHKRETRLMGEAFFEVTKDSLYPFSVHSGGLTTTALGTSFNINYRPDRLVTEVSLVTGSVQVTTKDKTGGVKVTKLQPGERLIYDTREFSFQIDNFDTLETLAWKEGILYFKKAGIEQVVQKLEDWYGVEVSLEGNLNRVNAQQWTYTGMFKNQSLEHVLTGISYVKGFHFEINDKNITLMFN